MRVMTIKVCTRSNTLRTAVSCSCTSLWTLFKNVAPMRECLGQRWVLVHDDKEILSLPGHRTVVETSNAHEREHWKCAHLTRRY